MELSKTTHVGKVKAMGLASRASLCINNDVKAKAPTTSELNDSCLDAVSERKCPYYTQELSVDAIAAQFSTLLHKVNIVFDLIRNNPLLTSNLFTRKEKSFIYAHIMHLILFCPPLK